MANCNPAVVAGLASCFTCLTPAQRQAAAIFLLCKIDSIGGVGKNLVPPGSKYGGGSTPEFDLAVQPMTAYNVCWGSNELSMTIGNTTYPSTGAGNCTAVWTAGNTLMKFFGNFAGTTVTVRVVRYPGIPSVSGLSVVPSGTGTTVTASWDAIPTIANTPITRTEVFTSSDNVNFTLAGTVAAPGTSLSGITAPTLGNTLYVKARWDSGVSLIGPFSPVVSILGSITDWAKRVVTNGGALPSQSTINAMQTFYNTLVSQGLKASMLEVCCFVPDNLIACITPLIKTSGSDPWTNHGPFVAGDVSVNGLTGNGSTKYLDTGFIDFNSIPSNNNGNSVYAFAIGGTPGELSGTGGGSANEALMPNFTGGGNSQYWSQTIEVTTTQIGAGFYSGSRTASNFMAMYFANSTTAWAQKSSSASASGGLSSHSTYVFALDGAGTPFGFSNSTVSFFAIHKGLSSALGQALFNAVDALRVALGGGRV